MLMFKSFNKTSTNKQINSQTDLTRNKINNKFTSHNQLWLADKGW